jgi:hypothetical protein
MKYLLIAPVVLATLVTAVGYSTWISISHVIDPDHYYKEER